MQNHLSDVLRCVAILYSITGAVFSEWHDHWASRERRA